MFLKTNVSIILKYFKMYNDKNMRILVKILMYNLLNYI